jgi:hypothetical protein
VAEHIPPLHMTQDQLLAFKKGLKAGITLGHGLIHTGRLAGYTGDALETFVCQGLHQGERVAEQDIDKMIREQS